MCLVTTDATIKIAKKDMIVYKLGTMSFSGKYFISEMQNYTYLLGVLNTCVISEPDADGQYYDQLVFDYYQDLSNKKYITIGFHSAKKKDRLSGYSFTQIVKCTIPKGSQYIEDKTGLVVSNQIIINKEVKPS